jgi:ABC-2 type transport system ATP-binding protein
VKQRRLDPKKRLKELSKGGYARVGLALALAAEPSVLILDEPTSGLDRRTRREFLATLVEFAAEGRTILVSSHSIAELERFASHAAFMKDGQIVLSSTLDDLTKLYRRISYRIVAGSPDPGDVGKVVDEQRIGKSRQVVVRAPDAEALAAFRNSPDIADFEETKLSLEEVYDAVLGKPPERERAPIGPKPDDDEFFEDEEGS